MVDDRVLRAVREHPKVAALVDSLERDVTDGRLTATLGAEAILRAFGLL
jgi:LAO/AO transport system kinase